MPTYDYECKECGYTFEHFQMMSDQPLTTCPSCGGPVRRLIGGGLGVIFKGSGFYVTDNKSAKPPVGTSSEEKPKGKSKETKKAETTTTKQEKEPVKK